MYLKTYLKYIDVFCILYYKYNVTSYLNCALSCAVYCNRPCLFVCLFVCGSALLQPARSVCVASERFFICICI